VSVARGSARASGYSLGLLSIATVGCAVSPHLVPFFFATVLAGMGHAGVHVSRQAQVVAIVPQAYRARALTTLAGIWRIGNFVGPVVAAIILKVLNEAPAAGSLSAGDLTGLRTSFLFAAVMIAAGAFSLVPTPAWREKVHAISVKQVSARKMARDNRRVLSTLGVAIGMTNGVRYVRLVAISLWGEHIGLSGAEISAIFALSTAIDMMLFYPAGVVMDRWGRWWTAIPSTALFAAVAIAFPFATNGGQVTLLAVGLGLANGWGSGLLMTLGTDVAPAQGRPVFTGWWMTLQDVGGLAGSGVLAAGTAVSAATGLFAAGGVGIVATLLLHRFIPPWRLSRKSD
jgi:MFS family permease